MHGVPGYRRYRVGDAAHAEELPEPQGSVSEFFPLRFRFTFQPTVIDILLIVPVLAWYQRQFAAPCRRYSSVIALATHACPFSAARANSTDSMCSCLIFMNHLPRSFCLTIFVINFGVVLKFPARCLLQAHRATFRNQFPHAAMLASLTPAALASFVLLPKNAIASIFNISSSLDFPKETRL